MGKNEGGCSYRKRGTNEQLRLFRTQTIAYLESIPLGLLSQLHTSLKLLNKRDQDRWNAEKKKAKTKSKSRKSRKRQEISSDSEKEISAQESSDEEEAVIRSLRAKHGDQLGVRMPLLNRATG